jgi:hypothetical protein
LTYHSISPIIIKNKIDMYVIIKHIKMTSKKVTSKRLPVILLNSDTEVWEFETEEEAENMKNIFQANSDSGHIYQVKKL